jgi:hypothetical protein
MTCIRPTRPIRRWLTATAPLVLLALIVGACSDDDVSDRRRELRAHRALWESQGLDDYRFVVRRSCFCPPDLALPTLIDVRADVPVRAMVVADESLIPAHLGLTVEDIFRQIERAIDGGFELIDVRYDPEMGYPIQATLDPGGGIQDAGMDFSCSDVTPLDAAESCPPPVPPVPCDCSATAPANIYRYIAWTDSGRLLAEGCVALTFSARAGQEPGVYDLTGERCLNVRCAADLPDAHHGTNAVAGSLDAEGRLWLDLNAGWADNNIFLLATGVEPQAGYLSGEWAFSTISGPQKSGLFLLDRTIHPQAIATR